MVPSTEPAIVRAFFHDEYFCFSTHTDTNIANADPRVNALRAQIIKADTVGEVPD